MKLISDICLINLYPNGTAKNLHALSNLYGSGTFFYPIYGCTYTPAAFDELEDGIDEYGNVIIGGKYRQRSFKYDKVFADGFSSITIWAENPKGKVITLLSKQCATCMLTQ